MALTRRGFAAAALALGTGGCTALGADGGSDGPPDFAASFARQGAGKVEVIIDGGEQITEGNTRRIAVTVDGDRRVSWSPPLDDRERRVVDVSGGGALEVVWVGPDGRREVIEQFRAGG